MINQFFNERGDKIHIYIHEKKSRKVWFSVVAENITTCDVILHLLNGTS